MKILIILKTNVGGMWLLPQITAMQARGYKVLVAIPEGPGKLRVALDAHQISVYPIQWDFSLRPRLQVWIALKELRSLVKTEMPDIIFYHLILSALVGRIVALGTPARTVHMVAGPLYLESRALSLLESLMSRMDDEIIAGSAYTASKYSALGYPIDRLTTIPYGVNTTHFLSPSDPTANSKIFTCIMVAYFYAPKKSVFRGKGIKGHETLIEAWRTFHENNPNSRILFVGSGFNALGDKYRSDLIAESHLLGAVWVETVEDVRQYYGQAHISISPSLSENHGAALEASSMSLPVIVSDAGALPEATSDTAGWVFKAGDVDDLLDKLNRAHDEFRIGILRQRGLVARTLICRDFDSERLSNKVVDVISDSYDASRSLLVIAEQKCTKRDRQLYGQSPLGALSGISERRHVTVLARASAKNQILNTHPLIAGSTGALVQWRNIFDLFASIPRLYAHMRRASAVLVYTPGSISSIAGILALVTQTPLAVVVAGDPAESLRQPVTNGIWGYVQRPAMREVTRMLASRADIVRYVTRQALQDRYPSRKLTFGAFSVREALDFRIRQNSSESATRILTVASLAQPYKGVEEVIDAVAILRNDGMEIELTVAGDGALRTKLQAKAENILGDASHFLGHLDADALSIQYGQADIFVLNSWSEGLPRALVEAMGSGLACIATTVGGNRELLDEEFLVPPKQTACLVEAIRSLAQSPDRRVKAGERNAAHARTLIAEANAVHAKFIDALADLGN